MAKSMNSKGFTLVELLIAMAVFSFIILFVTTGFIIVNRAYTRGLTIKLVQDEGRRLVEDLSREIRASSGVDSSAGCLLVNGSRYTWVEAYVSGDAKSPKKLLRDSGASCESPVTPIAGSDQVLNDRVGVQYMGIELISGGSYQITVVLSTTEVDLLDAGSIDSACGVGTGSEYCDVVKYTTVVSSR